MTRSPTPVVALAAGGRPARARLAGPTVAVSDGLLRALRNACAQVDTDPDSLADASRDWWPLAVHWALGGQVPALPSVVARPTDTSQLAAVLYLCNQAEVPVTTMAGRSGVCGASVPAFGGVALDMCGLAGIMQVDDTSLLVKVAAGTFGPDLEDPLRRDYQLTIGHWPQSMALSTVGGWVACRSAGQYSTRYGKIEDIVAGLEVVLASGQVIHTGGRAPRSATGPDLTRCLVGSEGTLGVITSALLRAHPLPPTELSAAYTFESFEAGLEACRLTLRRGATPAVLRLYDEAESARSLGISPGCALVALDEGDEAIVGASMGILDQECREAGGEPAGPGQAGPGETGPGQAGAGGGGRNSLVEHWLRTRNDVPSLGDLYGAGLVVDTIEVAARWSGLPGLYRSGVAALAAVGGTIGASAHCSHAYTDGGCVYFTFAGQPGAEKVEDYYRACWAALMTATISAGGTISHHHGIGLNRARWMRSELGAAFDALSALKAALDPVGILNPGKLGLNSPWGPSPWQ
ncbi:MAG: FAD-binding oxidoreductase [Acidimicrobiales bacterium]